MLSWFSNFFASEIIFRLLNTLQKFENCYLPSYLFVSISLQNQTHIFFIPASFWYPKWCWLSSYVLSFLFNFYYYLIIEFMFLILGTSQCRLRILLNPLSIIFLGRFSSSCRVFLRFPILFSSWQRLLGNPWKWTEDCILL